DVVEVDLKGLGDHLRDLDEQALPHLGAAVVERHAAVRIDIDQRAGLVERRPVERDAELDRHGGEALLHHLAAAIEVRHVAAPPREVDTALELVDHTLDDVVLDGHAVWRDVVAANAVEIPSPHRIDAEPELARHQLDDGFDCKHALRAAVAAEGGVRYGVGL